jgi:Na+/H+-dicarboxylate symporter
MTSQATQIRARYGRMYALVTTLAAMAVVGTVWANTSGPQTGIDVSAMMSSTDTSRLPVQTIADAF